MTDCPCNSCSRLHHNGSCSIYHNCPTFRGWFAKEWRKLRIFYGAEEGKHPVMIRRTGTTYIWRVYQEGNFHEVY